MEKEILLQTIRKYYPSLDKQKIKKAVNFVCKLDEDEGYTQASFGITTAIRTCIIAIQAGLSPRAKDDSPIYDAIVMLQQILLEIESNNRVN